MRNAKCEMGTGEMRNAEKGKEREFGISHFAFPLSPL
jgi:hypothetical protein